jgi:hypothetical protein
MCVFYIILASEPTTKPISLVSLLRNIGMKMRKRAFITRPLNITKNPV